MVRTAKEWAEIIAKIAEADPNQKVWIYCYTRYDVEVDNSPEKNGGLTNDDWEAVVEEFERICDSSALEQVWEAFSDATSSELNHIRCSGCYEYDYEVKDDNEDMFCAGCGEEQDIVAPEK